MDKEKIIGNAALRLGIEQCHHILLECSIDMASALLQREGAMRDESPDPGLIASLNSAVNGRIADLLVAIELVCIDLRGKDVRAELQKRMVRIDVQNLGA